MNILYLCDEYPPGRHGGIGTVVQILARELVQQGHNVVVAGFYDWGYGGEDEFDDNGVKVYRFRRALSSRLFAGQDKLHVRALYKFLNASGIFQWDIRRSLEKYGKFIEQLVALHAIDIIEMPDYNDYIRFCKETVYFPRLPSPVVVKLHGSLTYIHKNNGQPVPEYVAETEKAILRNADAVCAVSQYRADMATEFGEYDGDIDVVYNGINMQGAEPDTTDAPRINRVVFTGALSENKGIFKLAKAWNIINERIPDASMIVLGKGPINRVTALIDPKYHQNISFMGHVDRRTVLDTLKTSTIAVFPSLTESFALAPMEAMACGAAVIYTTRASGPELITHEVNGLLANPLDIDDIAHNICYLYQNQDICSKLAAAGKERIKSEFDISVVARKNISYYTSVIEKRK
ncbi:MAG TPA: glycosyltransferase family 4 protein [Flavipsychrobacter sp.]